MSLQNCTSVTSNCYGLFPYFRIRIATTIKNSYLRTLTRALSTNRTRISKEDRFFCRISSTSPTPVFCKVPMFIPVWFPYMNHMQVICMVPMLSQYGCWSPGWVLCWFSVWFLHMFIPGWFLHMFIPGWFLCLSFVWFLCLSLYGSYVGLLPGFCAGPRYGSWFLILFKCRPMYVFYSFNVVLLVLKMDFCRVI